MIALAASIAIPGWILALQQRHEFVDLAPDAIERVVAKYGLDEALRISGKQPQSSQAGDLHKQGIETAKMAPDRPQTKISPLPAYLARAAKNLPTASPEARKATIQAFHAAQIDLF